MEVNLGIKNNKTLQHSVSSSSVYMCLLYFLLLCFVFRHLINVCIESLRNMHLNFVNHVILICKQDLHLRTDVLCLGIGITIILCIITKYSIATYRITCIFLLLSHFANYFVNTISYILLLCRLIVDLSSGPDELDGSLLISIVWDSSFGGYRMTLHGGRFCAFLLSV